MNMCAQFREKEKGLKGAAPAAAGQTVNSASGKNAIINSLATAPKTRLRLRALRFVQCATETRKPAAKAPTLHTIWRRRRRRVFSN